MIREIPELIIEFIHRHPNIFRIGLVFLAFLILMILYLIFRKQPIRKTGDTSGSDEDGIKESDDWPESGSRTIQISGSAQKGKSYLHDHGPLLIFLLIICIGILAGLLVNIARVARPTSGYTFGIDVSHYQGRIDWDKVMESHHPIEFVFIRATMGTNSIDKEFRNNWGKVKSHDLIRGAYHFYRPHEDSFMQFKNFTSVVRLEAGDLPPVLDVESLEKIGVRELKAGVLNWLKLAEEKYLVKPVVYTNRKFYRKYLRGHINEYPLWIASHSGKYRLLGIDWTLHQFTSRVRVKGIRGTVDGNDFNGDLTTLKNICKKDQGEIPSPLP